MENSSNTQTDSRNPEGSKEAADSANGRGERIVTFPAASPPMSMSRRNSSLRICAAFTWEVA